MKQCPSRLGFTLIELLVVITIIVVLLSLLTPALDKAIYRAELAKCGAHQRGIANAAIQYAFANKRAYPAVTGGRGYNFSPDILGWVNNPAEDIRPVLREYWSLKLLLCPLTEEVALDEESNDPDTHVIANYDMWFGWQYKVNGSHAAMRKVGDRFGYTDPNITPARTDRFSVLSSDLNYCQENPFSQSTHPDRNGLLTQEVYRDEVPNGLPMITGINRAITFSRWTGAVVRSSVDLNSSLADGSVRFHQEVPFGMDNDLGYVPLPITNVTDTGADKIYLAID